MRLRTAVLISLLVAVAGAFGAFRFLPPIPFTLSPFPIIADALLLGRLGSAALIGIAIYAAAVSALIGGGAIRKLTGLRRHFESLESESDGPIDRNSWEAAFSGTTVESHPYRIIATSFANGSDRPLLAAPFSPPVARAELRRIYPRRLALAQVWTIAFLMPGIIAAAALSAAPLDTTFYLARAVAIGETLLLGSIGFAMLGISIAIDGLISTIARLPLMVDPGSSSIASKNDIAALESLSTNVAAPIRAETQATLARLEKLTAQALESQQRLLERLTESLPGAIFESIEKTLASALQNSDKRSPEADGVRADLINAFDILTTKLAQQFSAQCEKIVEHFGVAISAERGLLQEELSGLRHTFSQAAERQLDDLRRLAAEDRETIQQLGEGIRQIAVENQQEKHAGFAKMIELIQSVEAYAATLLPAVRRLEGCEERVAAAMAYESETLSRLSVFVKEMSGTLEAVQVALAHGRAEIVPILVRTPDASGRLVQGARSENVDMPDFVFQLRSLLDDLEEEKPSST